MLIGETETTTRTCKLYLLNVNQIGDIRDRKFYTVCGDIIGEDEEGIEIEIDLTKYAALKEALAEQDMDTINQLIEQGSERPLTE